jgi:hypothetical protein
MPYPIRYRLLDKETRQPVHFEDKEYFMFLTGEGMPVRGGTHGYYPSFSWQSCSKYILEVATKKDEKGNWVYEQCGY